MDKLIIHTKTLEFITWLFPTINKFPRTQRFVLGQQTENAALKLLKNIIQANNQRDKVARAQTLEQAAVELQVLRSLLRVAHSLKFLSHSQLEFSTEKLLELGKILGAWKNKTT